MKVTYHTIGGAMLEFEVPDIKEAIVQLAFLGSIPEQCPVCQKELMFTYRTPKNYKYYGVRCTGTPSHATSFGVSMEGGGLFYKSAQTWTVYIPGQTDDEPAGNGANHSNSSTLPTSSPASAGNYQSQRDQELNNPNLSEPAAEIDRLNKLIAQEWHSKQRSQSYDALVRERYGVSPDKLRINQLRDILDKLQGKTPVTAGANNGR